MQPLKNFSPCHRLHWLVLSALAIPAALGADLNYKVTLNGGSPVPDAYVTLQTPGGTKTIVTKTDAWGQFKANNIPADRVLVTIEKNGSVVYRGIKGVAAAPAENVIDLTAVDPGAPHAPAPAPKAGLAKAKAGFKAQAAKSPAANGKSDVAKQ